MHVYIAGEALTLGLVSGPACLASCGPLLVPWSIEQGQRASRNAIQLAYFLAARFCGYLVFATVAWALGRTIPSSSTSALVYGIAHLLLGVLLVFYALGRWRHGACAATAVSNKQQLVNIGEARAVARMWAPVFGFLTGLSLCPPFIVAGMRIMELPSLAPAILFFSMFFAGTLVWFVPFLFLGLVRWKEQIMFVARITLLLLSAYYVYLGIIILVRRLPHG